MAIRNGTWKKLLFILIPIMFAISSWAWNMYIGRIEALETKQQQMAPTVAEHGIRLDSSERALGELRYDVKDIQKDVKELLRRR